MSKYIKLEDAKSLINDFKEYQKDWIANDDNILFEIQVEEFILAFLDDSAQCFISERIADEEAIMKGASNDYRI